MTLIWSADLTQPNSNSAGFQDINYNQQTAAGDGPAAGLAFPLPVGAAPDGIRSVQVYLPGAGKRNEIQPTGGNGDAFNAADNFYFSQQFYLPAGFDTTAAAGSQYQVIEQMRENDDTGSPVAAFEVRNGSLLLTGGYGVTGASPANEWQYSQTLVPVVTGQRYSLIYRMGPFSATAGATTIDVWVNGIPVLSGYSIPPPTIIGGSTYRKMGLYRDPANLTTQTLWQSGQGQGTTYADVAALAGTIPIAPLPASPVVTTPSSPTAPVTLAPVGDTVSPVVNGRAEPSSAVSLLLDESHAVTSRAMLLSDDQTSYVELPLVSGSVSIDSTQIIRRTASLVILGAWSDDPTSRLTPYRGSKVEIQRGVRVAAGSTEWVPLMVGRIVETEQPSDNAGAAMDLTLNDDFFALAQDRFDFATQTDPTEGVVAAITRFITETLPNATVIDLTGSTQLCGTIDLQQDRAGGIDKLATSIGAECYCGRDGSFIIRPTPTLDDPPQWQVQTGTGGNIISVDRQRVIDGTTYNRVLAMGVSADSTTAPVYADASISDQTNPLWYGGPFGRVTRFYASALLTTVAQCQTAASALLSLASGKNYAMSFSTLVNPALDGGDVILSVLTDGITRTHIVDAVSLPLSPSDPQAITTRTQELPPESGN